MRVRRAPMFSDALFFTTWWSARRDGGRWMGNACHCVVKGNLYRSNHKLTCSYSLQAVPPKVDCFVALIRYHEQITSKSERRAGLATG